MIRDILSINVLCRILRTTSSPPIQLKQLKQAYGCGFTQHITNIESGRRRFPFKRIDAIIDAFAQSHNRPFIRFVCYFSQNYISFYKKDMPNVVCKIIALKKAGLLSAQAEEELEKLCDRSIPGMPDEIYAKQKDFAKYAIQKKNARLRNKVDGP